MNLNLDPQTLQLAEASQLQGAYLQQIDHLQPSRTDFPPLYDETNPKKTVWDRNHTPSSTNPEEKNTLPPYYSQEHGHVMVVIQQPMVMDDPTWSAEHAKEMGVRALVFSFIAATLVVMFGALWSLSCVAVAIYMGARATTNGSRSNVAFAKLDAIKSCVCSGVALLMVPLGAGLIGIIIWLLFVLGAS